MSYSRQDISSLYRSAVSNTEVAKERTERLLTTDTNNDSFRLAVDLLETALHHLHTAQDLTVE